MEELQRLYNEAAEAYAELSKSVQKNRKGDVSLHANAISEHASSFLFQASRHGGYNTEKLEQAISDLDY